MMDYSYLLKNLLPPGIVFTDNPDSTFSKVLKSYSKELERLDQAARDLIAESNPTLSYQTLDSRLAEWGLPDICAATLDQSTSQKRLSLTSKMANVGGQSRNYFISVCEELGYPGATIEEFVLFTCADNCNSYLHGATDPHTWKVNLPSTGGTFYMDCTSSCQESLAIWGDVVLECRINTLKPAHTRVEFAYI